MYEDLREWLQQVGVLGELLEINETVDWEEEMAAITYLVASQIGAPALLFKNIKGYPPGYHVLFNGLGTSTKRIALSMGISPEKNIKELIIASKEKLKQRIPPIIIPEEDAVVNENVHQGEEVDVYEFPAPKMWPLDGDRYIGTGDVVITMDPKTKNVNVGTYRQMILGNKEVGFYVSPGKDGLLHRERWWREGKPCPVAAVYGVDPLLFIVGSQSFPKDLSEYDFAGGFRGEGVKVFTSKITGLPIPANAEIVIEGFSYPNATKPEGPFGEFTGYYGKPGGETPLIDIKCIRHRNNPILTCALMAEYPSCELNQLYSIIRSARVWDDLDRLGIPGIKGVYCHPAAAGGFGMLTISLEQHYAGHASQVLALAAQCPGAAYYTKWIIVVDEDVDPTEINQILWAMSTRCNPAEDLDILRQTWSTYLDPSQNPLEIRPYGSKVLINACKQHRFINSFARRTYLREEIYKRVKARWQELGLPAKPPEIQKFEEMI